MQCVTPMIRYYKIYTPEEKKRLKAEGKKQFNKIIPRDRVLKGLEIDPNYLRHWVFEENERLEQTHSLRRYQLIPCRNCWACNLKYSAEWAQRIMFECSLHQHNYFITLTYDELNLPLPESATYNGVTYENDGTWSGTLYTKDVDKFLNTWRKRLERKGFTGLKYFYCGEYGPTGPNSETGSLGHRPHYHMIAMNAPLDITEFYDFDKKNGKLIWKSHELDEIWDKGFCEIGEVEFASAAYVARYCMKKLTTNKDKTYYYSQGKEPEFVRMSRRPGIGSEYYEQHKEEIYETDNIPFKNFHGKTINYKPNHAWDKKFEEEFPERFEEIKQSRIEASERSRKLLQELTNATDLQRLEQAAEKIITKGKMLPREDI